MAATSITVQDWRRDVPGVMINPETYALPQINSVNSHGKPLSWRIFVRISAKEKPTDDADYLPIPDHYFNNEIIKERIFGVIKVESRIADGKIKKSSVTVVTTGKNLGRANFTNIFCQTLRDALSAYNKQLKKAIGDVNTTRLPPMLAQNVKSRPPIDWTQKMFIQRKYNGVRTVTKIEEGKVIMYSRRKILYPGFSYIKADLTDVLTDFLADGYPIHLDGEIYKHGTELKDISGYSRAGDVVGQPKMEYMIYDCFDPERPNLTFEERYKILLSVFEMIDSPYVRIVDTYEVKSDASVDEYYKSFIAEGYEGAMLRRNVPYVYSINERHSDALLKIKPIFDAEYEIIGWETGKKGKASDAIMINCKNEAGKTFNVTPALEINERNTLAEKMPGIEPNGKTFFENNYLGKKIRVYYDEMSSFGIPQRARTKLERMNIDIVQ